MFSSGRAHMEWALNAFQRSGLRIMFGLAWRHLAGRLFSVLSLLVAANVYDLSIFSNFGMYLAALNVTALLTFMRYEGAIVGASSAKEVSTAVRACIAIAGTILMSLGAVIIALIANDLMSLELGILFVGSFAVRGWLRLAVTYATRIGSFHVLGRATLVQSLIQPLILLGLLLTPMPGLISLMLADFIGHGIAALVAVALQRKPLEAELGKPIIFADIKAFLQRWSALPLFNLPGALFSVGFIAAPLLLTPMIADASVAGALALAYRLLDFPTQLMGASATPLIMNHVRGESTKSMSMLTKWLGVYSITIISIFVAIMIGAIWVLPFFPSGKWHYVMMTLPFLAMFHASLALAGPVTEAAAQFPDQRMMTVVHFLALISSGIIFLMINKPLATLLVLISIIAFLRAVAIISRLLWLYHHSLSHRS